MKKLLRQQTTSVLIVLWEKVDLGMCIKDTWKALNKFVSLSFLLYKFVSCFTSYVSLILNTQCSEFFTSYESLILNTQCSDCSCEDSEQGWESGNKRIFRRSFNVEYGESSKPSEACWLLCRRWSKDFSLRVHDQWKLGRSPSW